MVHIGYVQVITFSVGTMTWLTVTVYLCCKLRRIFSICRNTSLSIHDLQMYQQNSNQRNTVGTTSGVGTAYFSGASVFILGLCFSIFSFMCIVLEIVVCHFHLGIVLSVLFRFTDSDDNLWYHQTLLIVCKLGLHHIYSRTIAHLRLNNN